MREEKFERKMIQYMRETALAALVLAATGLGCSNSGYNERCEQVISPIRQRFKEVCESRIDRTLEIGLLDRIVQKRERELAKAGCERKETWRCGRRSYFAPGGGKYEMSVD